MEASVRNLNHILGVGEIIGSGSVLFPQYWSSNTPFTESPELIYNNSQKLPANSPEI